MLLGDYAEVERWIDEGRVDCGFLRLPAAAGLDAIPLKRDEYYCSSTEAKPRFPIC